MSTALPSQIGRYRVLEKLGEGGMGVVYAGHDEALDRRIALKTIRVTGDDSLRERFWREARAAASVSHPNVCPIYEVGEDTEGRLFLAMELLEGEPLSERVRRGPLSIEESLRIECDILSALEALHARHLIHRDLKPSNVFLTRHGVKLVDFGLARPTANDPLAQTGITQPGTVLGTPRYMAPEQVTGQELDGRADLFAAGVLLYEMLSGRAPFDGETMMQVLHAVVYEEPPLLAGPPPTPAIDKVIRRALAKRREERYDDAASMALALREAVGPSMQLAVHPGAPETTPTVVSPIRPTTRLIVLPFRMLRPDPEIDFLSFSLADAVASGLAGIPGLTVRPSGAVPAMGGESTDISKIAREANVDVVLTGTLLRSGSQVRVTTQLLQVPAGTLLASHVSNAPLGDLFQLEDELTHRIVDALALPLTSREKRLVRHDAPADPGAYELYLRANKLTTDPRTWAEALQLYRECVEKDASYAPAWARMGRVARIMAKFGEENRSELLRTADVAFRRALEINPDFSTAHHLQAYLEVELGRGRFAMVRLLDRVRTHRNDPDLYAGLVIACRYCGLLEASAAAHEQARKLDPGARTSVPYTYIMMTEWERALAADDDPLKFPGIVALSSMERIDEAEARAQQVSAGRSQSWLLLSLLGYIGAGRRDREAFLKFHSGTANTGFYDPEAFVLTARSATRVGLHDLALEDLDRAIRGGYFVPSFLRSDPWLEPLRERPEFQRLLADATKLRAEARAHYIAAGGEQLLGVGTAGAP